MVACILTEWVDIYIYKYRAPLIRKWPETGTVGKFLLVNANRLHSIAVTHMRLGIWQEVNHTYRFPSELEAQVASWPEYYTTLRENGTQYADVSMSHFGIINRAYDQYRIDNVPVASEPSNL